MLLQTQNDFGGARDRIVGSKRIWPASDRNVGDQNELLPPRIEFRIVGDQNELSRAIGPRVELLAMRFRRHGWDGWRSGSQDRFVGDQIDMRYEHFPPRFELLHERDLNHFFSGHNSILCDKSSFRPANHSSIDGKCAANVHSSI